MAASRTAHRWRIPTFAMISDGSCTEVKAGLAPGDRTIVEIVGAHPRAMGRIL